MHTHMNRPCSSLDWVSSHWAHVTVLRLFLFDDDCSCAVCHCTVFSSWRIDDVRYYRAADMLPKLTGEALRPMSHQFLAHFYCGQTAGHIKMPLGMEVGLSPGDFVLDGDSSTPPQKRKRSPQFSSHVYCGQTAEWINMPLGTEVGLAQTTLC